jgi:hypothetical protein
MTAARDEIGPWLEELTWRLRAAVDRRPVATLALAAVAGFSLAYLPGRWLIGALAMGGRALGPVALRRLDEAVFGERSNSYRRKR